MRSPNRLCGPKSSQHLYLSASGRFSSKILILCSSLDMVILWQRFNLSVSMSSVPVSHWSYLYTSRYFPHDNSCAKGIKDYFIGLEDEFLNTREATSPAKDNSNERTGKSGLNFILLISPFVYFLWLLACELREKFLIAPKRSIKVKYLGYITPLVQVEEEEWEKKKYENSERKQEK